MDKETISRVMRAMGSRGGKAGGLKRMDSLSAEERSALAKRAVDAREAKRAASKEIVATIPAKSLQKSAASTKAAATKNAVPPTPKKKAK